VYIWSTHRVLNRYGYSSGMGMGKDSYPWVRVRVEFYTHRLGGYGYGIVLPCPYPTHCILSSKRLVEFLCSSNCANLLQKLTKKALKADGRTVCAEYHWFLSEGVCMHDENSVFPWHSIDARHNKSKRLSSLLFFFFCSCSFFAKMIPWHIPFCFTWCAALFPSSLSFQI
jgi:hypothetical protein